MGNFTTLTTWDTETILAHVRNDGIVVLDRYFGGDTLAALSKEFLGLFDEGNSGVHVHHKTAHLQAQNINTANIDARKFPTIDALTNDPLLHATAATYFDKPIIYPHKLFATWSYGTEAPVDKLPNVTHTDRFQMFKYMIYLHDVTAASGAMAVVPGRHKELAAIRQEWIRSGKPYEERPNILRELDSELVPVEAKAGSILVFDTDVPHKAGHVLPGLERHALRIDIVCPAYAGTNGKRSFLDRLLRKKVVTD